VQLDLVCASAVADIFVGENVGENHILTGDRIRSKRGGACLARRAEGEPAAALAALDTLRL
jgi:hypothetical protein